MVQEKFDIYLLTNDGGLSKVGINFWFTATMKVVLGDRKVLIWVLCSLPAVGALINVFMLQNRILNK